MYDTTDEDWQCPQCGYAEPANNRLEPNAFFKPWNLAHGRAAVKAYVASLGQEAHEWLLALYVDGELNLLAVDTVARGGATECPVPFWKLLHRAHTVEAAGFILVHNHPSGDPTPSVADVRVTRRLAHVSHELDFPLLDHFIIAGDEMREIAEWYWRDEPYDRRLR